MYDDTLTKKIPDLLFDFDCLFSLLVTSIITSPKSRFKLLIFYNYFLAGSAYGSTSVRF